MNAWITGWMAACLMTGGAVAESLAFDPPPMPEKPVASYNVRDYGAKGDGKTRDTGAFEAALAKAAVKPGSEVRVPPGDYLIGSIVLPTKTTLRVEKDAKIQGTDDFADYPVETWRWEGREVPAHRALVSARNAEDIAIIGGGTIRGNDVMQSHLSPHRPMLVELMRCKRVVIAGVRLENFNVWCLHPTYCEDVLIDGVHFHTRGRTSDGIDPDSSRRVMIRNCVFDTGDDAIAIKSGLGQEGARIGLPSEDIIIRDCQFKAAHGGVAFGSECSGGIRRVTVENCDFGPGVRWASFYMKSRPGRGAYIEDITARNNVSASKRAIWILFNYQWTPDTQGVPGKAGLTRAARLRFENLTIKGGRLMEAVGLKEAPIDGLDLINIQGTCAKGPLLAHARNVRVENLDIEGYKGARIRLENVEGSGIEDAVAVKDAEGLTTNKP
jgi:hypothetical protein